eukprot:TRINITY_DN1811_c0_g1_i8.p2 TRINITY_DN1811_c0_g1~~TRINITY_DN1811_c0_g1_i8.p2  ORF type:complete len:145 (-),score=15.17 TRINITY_DN1811_c0_g1_i8:228-662(-)
MGDCKKALEYHLKSMNIIEKVLGVEHPDTATSYNNIGFVYDNMGDYKKALEYYLKSVNIREKVLGVEHPGTATSYSNIGLVYENMRDYKKALEFMNKAYYTFKEKLGEENQFAKMAKQTIDRLKSKEQAYYLLCNFMLKLDPFY